IRCHEQGAAAARVPLRRQHDLLRVHAGGRHGQRPRHRLLPLRAGRPRAAVTTDSRSEHMPSFKYLIIGGGMTADAAAAGIREVDADGTIGIISAESDAPYSRPPLSKALWK